ncbi:uncharacterized protein VTP21DRAFT_6826 [Calcarisporiella thermophila]|uniref:uncharacterized protein n=1 Tax=Calcarisporiella thermophila TaxID=911321 RepID=UPI0037423EE1
MPPKKVKIRAHDGHFLSLDPKNKVLQLRSRDYNNDTSPERRASEGSLFRVGDDDFLYDDTGMRVVLEWDGGEYELLAEKFGPEEYGLKAYDEKTQRDTGRYLSAGINELRLKGECSSQEMFNLIHS